MLIRNDVQIQPTVEQQVASIKGVISRLYMNMKQAHTQAYNLVWNNKLFTPQEIVTAFGDDAIPLFTLSEALQIILANADPDYVFMLPEYTISVDGNGVITLVPRT